jgi:hypothetical protein
VPAAGQSRHLPIDSTPRCRRAVRAWERKLKDENGKMNLGQAMKMTAKGERDES